MVTTLYNTIYCTDYIPNANHLYVFTSETREQPIATQLLEDQTGESAEYFIICLPEQELQRMSAEAVAPTCVRVVILDDDCKP